MESLTAVPQPEAVMVKNLEREGQCGVEVNTDRRPTSRFGDGQRKSCLSTAKVEMSVGNRPGSMEVHVRNNPGQPILVSRRALRTLGAVIDFSSSSTNECLFKAVDRSKVVTLKEAENGHLLLPMTGDVLEGSPSRSTPFVGLLPEAE